MLTIESLNEFGADTSEGMSRCLNNEELYLKLVKSVTTENNFDKLNESISSGDLDSAFEAAHALKGVLGNLSLTPLYEKTVEITELLRERKDMDYTGLVSELDELKKRLVAICED